MKVLASDDLSETFGIEMAPEPPKRAAASTLATKPSTTAAHFETSSRPTRVIRPAKPKEPANKRREATQR